MRRSSSICLLIIFLRQGGTSACADDFDQLLKKVGERVKKWPAPQGGDPRLAEEVSDQAIRQRKGMVLRAVAADDFRPKARNPKHMFPVVLARLALNQADQEALDYVSRGMLYRGRDDTFAKSSLSRVFCRCGQLLEPEVAAALRQEVTTYPGFLGGGETRKG